MWLTLDENIRVCDKTKARKAETENSDQESEAESADEVDDLKEDLKNFSRTAARLRKTMTEEEKMELVHEMLKDEDSVLSESGF